MGKTLFCFFCCLWTRVLLPWSARVSDRWAVGHWRWSNHGVATPPTTSTSLGRVPGLAGRGLLGLGKHRTKHRNPGRIGNSASTQILTPAIAGTNRDKSSQKVRSDSRRPVPSTTSPTPKRGRLRGSCPLPLEKKKEVDIDEDFHPLPSEGAGGRTRRPIASSPGPNAQCVSAAAAVDQDMASSGVLQVRNWIWGRETRSTGPLGGHWLNQPKTSHCGEPTGSGTVLGRTRHCPMGGGGGGGTTLAVASAGECAFCCLSPPPISTDIAAMGVLGHRPVDTVARAAPNIEAANLVAWLSCHLCAACDASEEQIRVRCRRQRLRRHRPIVLIHRGGRWEETVRVERSERSCKEAASDVAWVGRPYTRRAERACLACGRRARLVDRGASRHRDSIGTCV